MIVIEKAGHLVLEEQPEEAARAVIVFLQEKGVDGQPVA
jgi:pimeloyl-ACP methyl ester carboxylesterase